MRYEQVIEQRDEIIKKLKKKYGVDPTKMIPTVNMPDPSLPVELQMQMVASGAT
tara:strand:+ start:343 stop:504 length:162 start_codon:yes stop_codon:yes gene_type:complete